MVVLFADSGSTKTEWALSPTVSSAATSPLRFTTSGLNPCLMSDEDLQQALCSEVLPNLSGLSVDVVRFYGAGCRAVHVERMERMLADVLGVGRVVVASDLLGAAHALCGRSAGIVAILGTGSGSALYDGERFVEQTPSMGYILGDEGSGAVLGRNLLSDIFKQQLPPHIIVAFHARYGLTLDDVIAHVYRQPAPNRYLASFSYFLSSYRHDAAIHEFLVRHFRRFFSRNVLPYHSPLLPVHFVGSLAAVFSDELHLAAEAEGCRVGRILPSPIDGLLANRSMWE